MSNQFHNLMIKDFSNNTVYTLNNVSILDRLTTDSYEFKSGNVYGLIGSFGTGATPLVHALSGYDKFYQGEIYFDKCMVNDRDLRKITCLVGNTPIQYRNRGKLKKIKVRTLLKKAIENNKKFDDTFENVVEQFDIERLEHDINNTSGEQWRILLALGYCMGKTVFCFTWLNHWYIRFNFDNFIKLFEFLKEKECIILIPTDKTEGIEKLFDEMISIKHPYNRQY